MKVRYLHLFVLVSLLALAFAVPLHAQETESDDETITETEFETTTSIWGNYVAEDSSKAEEYGEIPEGFLLSAFRAALRMKEDRFLEVRGRNVGLNNAQYGFEYGVSGNYRLYVDYSKIPHLFSKDGETIWTETSPGVWRLADATQQTVQNLGADPASPLYFAGLAAQRAFVSNLLTTAHEQRLGLQRNRGTVGFNMVPNTTWRYGFEYFQENRDGYRPLGTTFGFSWVTELPEHIDYDTERMRAAVEYTGNKRSFQFSYELSLFHNEVETMIWDNPLRITDRTVESPVASYINGDGTSQGRAQLPVDNSANTFSFAGATAMGNGRLTGSVSYSLWSDELDLLPFTINTAIEPIPLPSQTFSGEQHNLAANLRYTLPFAQKGNLTLNYRLFDHSNENDQFRIGEYVRLDQIEEPLHRFECDPAAGVCTEISDPPTPLYAYSSNTLDANVGWRLTKKLNWQVGYSFNRYDREFRDAETVDTNSFRTAIDAFLSERVTMRASYQYSSRRFDELEIDVPTYLPQFIPLRRFDIADLNRNTVRFIADFLLTEAVSLGITAGLERNDYPNTLFGLLEANNYSIGADVSYAPTETSSWNLWYEHSLYNSDQQGRQSGGTPSSNPGDNWTADIQDTTDTVGLGYIRTFGKFSWNTSALYARNNGEVDIEAGANLRPTGALDLLNADDTDLISARTGLTYRLFQRLRVGAYYWFDRYTIDDFAEQTTQTDLIFVPGPGGIPTAAGTILLNATQGDYQYHSGWIGVTYVW